MTDVNQKVDIIVTYRVKNINLTDKKIDGIVKTLQNATIRRIFLADNSIAELHTVSAHAQFTTGVDEL